MTEAVLWLVSGQSNFLSKKKFTLCFHHKNVKCYGQGRIVWELQLLSLSLPVCVRYRKIRSDSILRCLSSINLILRFLMLRRLPFLSERAMNKVFLTRKCFFYYFYFQVEKIYGRLSSLQLMDLYKEWKAEGLSGRKSHHLSSLVQLTKDLLYEKHDYGKKVYTLNVST